MAIRLGNMSMNRLQLLGKRFGRLTVLKPDESSSNRYFKWIVKCDCGTQKSVAVQGLRKGTTKSCGCLHLEIVSSHKLTRTRIYRSYQAMHSRCYNPNHRGFKNYGGRGIRICHRWKGNFNNFLKDIGFPPTNRHTLDRIDSNKMYSPKNCKWSTRKEQANNRRTNRLIAFRNQTKNLTEWSRVLNIHPATLNHRLNFGWSVEKALTQPIRKKNKSEVA